MNQELNKSMYYGATPSTFEKARQLRNNTTEEENILWNKLKGKQICNVRFRQQHPINMFIADFYCHAAKLVIELDGKIHLKNKEYDKDRSAILEDFGLKVIRIKNEEIITDINNVVNYIKDVINERLEHSNKNYII